MKKMRNHKGQSMVEFAVILPILVFIIMGILEFGLILNSYITLSNASREGARSGIVGSTDDEIKALVISTSPSLNAADLTFSITSDSYDRVSGSTLKVEIKYDYHLILPIISNMFGGTIPLRAETSMRIE